MVADIHIHYPSQGYRAINDTLLNDYGFAFSDISVLRSMQRLGIKGYVRRRRQQQTTEGAQYDRYPNILDWELSDTFDNFLVMKPAKRILEKAKRTGAQILLHSDQGIQYSSAGYCNLLLSYNAIQSMSRVGNPRDNAVMESFFGRFKDVLVSHFQYWKCENLLSAIQQAVHYFNYFRPVRKLNRKPPVQYRLELVA